MRFLLLCLILLSSTSNSFAKEKAPKPDPVLKKYQKRIKGIKKEYKVKMNKIKDKLISDYKARQKYVMKQGDLEAANRIQIKLKALQEGENGIKNADGEIGNEYNFDVNMNEDDANKNSKKKKKGKIEYTKNISSLATITASSSNNKKCLPNKVADGSIRNKLRHCWVSKKEAKGAWIQFSWKKPRRLSKIVLFSRNNPSDNIKKAIVIFNNKKKITIDDFPKKQGNINVDLKENIKVKSLKIKIIEGTSNGPGVGFREIEVYGEDK